MTPTRRATMSRLPLVVVAAVVVAVLIGPARADLDKDRAECADQLIGLATCLPYVGGDAKAPTIDCCTGLKPVLDKSKKCLCVLIKDRDDPNLGLKINATLALSLPDACHTPTNITECVELLKLDPKSADAKVFEGSSKSSNSSAPSPSAKTPTVASDTTTANGTSSSTPPNGSNGMKVNIGLVLGVASGALIWLFKPNLMF